MAKINVHAHENITRKEVMEQDTLYRTLKEIANGHVYVAICNMRDYASTIA